jgi:hypothetical protein
MDCQEGELDGLELQSEGEHEQVPDGYPFVRRVAQIISRSPGRLKMPTQYASLACVPALE